MHCSILITDLQRYPELGQMRQNFLFSLSNIYPNVWFLYLHVFCSLVRIVECHPPRFPNDKHYEILQSPACLKPAALTKLTQKPRHRSFSTNIETASDSRLQCWESGTRVPPYPDKLPPGGDSLYVAWKCPPKCVHQPFYLS